MALELFNYMAFGYEQRELLNDIVKKAIQLENENAVSSGTPVNAVNASGIITVSGTPVEDETMVIGATTYTFKTERAVAGEITISSNNATQVTNIVDAIMLDSTDVTAVDGAGDTVDITAVIAGTSGNDLVFTEDATGIGVNGSGKLAGGVDGTVGALRAMQYDSTHIHFCIAENTITGKNWRKVAIV